MKTIYKLSSWIMVVVFLNLAAIPQGIVVAAPLAVSLTTIDVPYTQNFDALSNVAGSTTNSSLPADWTLTESGGGARDNEQYAVDTGGSNTGDTYSYGAAGSTDRALGSLQSGTLIPTFGAYFTNNTGLTITSLDVAYTGEQWRLGTVARTDRIDFQYSMNATSLVTGIWTDVNALDFVTPDTATTGAKNGNTAADRTALSTTINGLSIPNGATFWIRWTDFNASGADDGLSVDDFSITPHSSAATMLSINDVSLNEGNAGTTSFTFTVSLSSPAPVGGVTFDIATADGTASTPADYVVKSLTGQIIPAGSSTYTFDVNANGDVNVETNEVFFVNISNIAGASVFDGQGLGTITNDDIALSAICDIQGSGSSAAITGTVTTQGVVVGDYEGASPAMRGFYLEDYGCDADPGSSDGIFIYNNSNASNVSLGDRVQVTGVVSEYSGQTQVTLSSFTVLSTGNVVTPTDVTLPFSAADFPERYEGMLVRFPQTLYVTEHYELGRYGQVLLSSGGRLEQPTNVVAPGSAANAMAASNLLNQILVDDARTDQNPDPILLGRGSNPLTATNTLRGGDSLTSVTGILGHAFGAYQVLPANSMGGSLPNFVPANPRPGTPNPGGSLKVAGMNLLNYFNTFGVGACTGGVSGASTDCRGAETQVEFDRQWPKTVTAIVAMNADVIGIVEMENDGYGSSSAIQHLVDSLNAATAPDTYAFVDVDSVTGQVDALGADAIKVGVIYKPATVIPAGTAALNTTAFVNGGDSAPRSRPALAQTFTEKASGAQFTLVVNHFKSKGTACDAPDAGDGQGNCNSVRVNAANELVDWLSGYPTGVVDPDFLIVGDLNSYAMEDPITTILSGGYVNLIERFGGAEAYSYAFDGQWGYLDHALASTTLDTQVVGAVDWHINSDEPAILDYNSNYKSASQLTSLYSADQYRISDHDPVVVGLDLESDLGEEICSSGGTKSGLNWEVSAPAGTLAECGYFQFVAASAASWPALGSNFVSLNHRVDISARTSSGAEWHNFTNPLTVCFDYGSADPAKFVIGTAQAGATAWQLLPTTMDVTNHKICAQVDHLSLFDLLQRRGTTQLPNTGFAPNRVTQLPEQPTEKTYTSEGMWLEIPALGIRQEIVGVPDNSGWDLSWLGKDIGYLEGTAFPTWAGNSVLTAHVYDANGKPGTFVGLNELKYGERVIIHAFGQKYIYEIRTVRDWVNPSATSILTRHEKLPWLTLLTCRLFDEETGTYRYRTVVRAVLVAVITDK